MSFQYNYPTKIVHVTNICFLIANFYNISIKLPDLLILSFSHILKDLIGVFSNILAAFHVKFVQVIKFYSTIHKYNAFEG